MYLNEVMSKYVRNPTNLFWKPAMSNQVLVVDKSKKTTTSARPSKVWFDAVGWILKLRQVDNKRSQFTNGDKNDLLQNA